MNYQQFLFVQLMCVSFESFRGLPYDAMWTNYKSFYDQFCNSDEMKDESIPEYEAILKWIENNRNELTKKTLEMLWES